MSITLIQKEIMLHVLSARFVALLLMCVLLIPLNFHINYRRYLQRQVDYQEAVKKENIDILSPLKQGDSGILKNRLRSQV